MQTAKNYCLFRLFLAVLFLIAANVRADLLTTRHGAGTNDGTVGESFIVFSDSSSEADTLTTRHGININDDTANESFYVFFNDMFGMEFTSSNDVFNAYGVDPYRTWTVGKDSQLSVGGRSFTGFDNTLYLSTLGSEDKINLIGSYSGDGFLNFGINYAVDLPVGSGFDFLLGVNHTDMHGNNFEYTLSSNPDNNGGSIHMLALDITALYNARYGVDFASVFMFLWEDYKDGTEVWWWSDWNPNNKSSESDWDYTDYMFIMTNVKHGDGATTPEPATLVILGLGLAGLGTVRARRRKNFTEKRR
jgi:hypothetical protein